MFQTRANNVVVIRLLYTGRTGGTSPWREIKDRMLLYAAAQLLLAAPTNGCWSAAGSRFCLVHMKCDALTI